jgi:hypothetical protein
MRHAKYFSILVFIIATLYGAVGFYCLPLASYQNELTRIGMLPDSLFSWTKAQPAIDPALLQQSSWQDAELLVVGDSFSEPGIWQTVLTGHGLRVHTEHWLNIRDICEDFSPWLRAQGFKGKYVVIESIERDANNHFDDSARCKQMHVQHRINVDKPREPPITMLDHDKRDYSGKMSVGIKTRINMYRYEQLSAQPDFKIWAADGVKVIRMPQGCELFSHPRCRDALFLGLDSNQDMGVDVINNMEILNARFEGLTPIWVVVPNKSTAYLYSDKRFWDKLEQRLRSVNLLKPIRQAINGKTVDVYPASNTHLSTTGYLLMGEEIYQNIQRGHANSTNAKTNP